MQSMPPPSPRLPESGGRPGSAAAADAGEAQVGANAAIQVRTSASYRCQPQSLATSFCRTSLAHNCLSIGLLAKTSVCCI